QAEEADALHGQRGRNRRDDVRPDQQLQPQQNSPSKVRPALLVGRAPTSRRQAGISELDSGDDDPADDDRDPGQLEQPRKLIYGGVYVGHEGKAPEWLFQASAKIASKAPGAIALITICRQ